MQTVRFQQLVSAIERFDWHGFWAISLIIIHPKIVSYGNQRQINR
ncbi:hypothetical protein SAMN05661012_00853 [Chitinophaga sancti]|uniref:Uncharacterized protein n=1 Tax=Chitinophaga sancti TaxID=1004 RepID=A0A1K1MSZ3_9BACT|nr:hypothetical protein SAMN05661012_00853 [Chitinophaga sancti]